MGKRCLKCAYEAPMGPDGYEPECPRCGVIYAKVEAAVTQQGEPKREALAQTSPTKASKPPPPPPVANYKKPEWMYEEERRIAAERAVASSEETPLLAGTGAGVGLALLGTVGVIALLSGLFAFALGTSAIHQILTGVYFLIFTVCFAAVVVVRAIGKASSGIRMDIRKGNARS